MTRMNFIFVIIVCLLSSLFFLCNPEKLLLKLQAKPNEDVMTLKVTGGKPKGEGNKKNDESNTNELIIEEASEPDPTQNYKLIAIYKIADQPRALIKNLSAPEEGAMEYVTGDFLDEFQIYSVSKITFSPTSRVEIIDQDGLSFLIKPHSTDLKSLPSSAKFPSSKAAPTFYAGGFMSKYKKAGSSNTQTESSSNIPERKEDIKPQVPDAPHPRKEETVVNPPPSGNSESPAQAPPPQAQPLTTLSTGSSTSVSGTPDAGQKTNPTNEPPFKLQLPGQGAQNPGDSTDTSRPANPFQ